VLYAVLIYIALQLAFGFWVARRLQTEEDYLLAGRSLGPWLGTFTIFATWFGAEVVIGASGQAYQAGLAGTAADPFGYALGIVIVGLIFAVPLHRRRLVTLADLYRDRFGPGVERLAAMVMIPTSLLWAAAQVRAFGQVLAHSSELGVFAAVTLAAVVVVAYVTAGGMLADAFSDLVQGAVLIAGILVIGGLFLASGGINHLAALPEGALSPVAADAHWLGVVETFAVPICGTIVAQELVARVLAVRNPALARRATVTAGFMYLAVGVIPVLLGLVALRAIGPVDVPEQVVLEYAMHYLPTVLYLVFVGALVSAILSTVDSALLVAASLTAHNLILPLRPELSERVRLRVNRIAVVAFGIVAYALALSSEGVYELVIEASSVGASGLFVLIVAALWLPRFGGAPSAVCAMVTGLGLYLAGSQLWALEAPFTTSLVAAAVVYAAAAPFGQART